MSDERDGDLNFIQLQRITDLDNLDENEVIKTFIQYHPRRLFTAKSLISNAKRIINISNYSFVL